MLIHRHERDRQSCNKISSPPSITSHLQSQPRPYPSVRSRRHEGMLGTKCRFSNKAQMTHLSSRAIFLILSIIVLVHGHSPKGRSHVLVSGLTFVGNTFTSSLHRQQRSQSLTRADYHSKLMHSSSPSNRSPRTITVDIKNTTTRG
jgi:hypothetical protein